MKYLDEFRNAELAKVVLDKIRKTVKHPWVIMEICGGQTHSIMQNGIDQLLPSQIELVHGPGCPVCVTSLELVDKALAIAALPNAIFCSFGDMVRVPGSDKDLFSIRAAGGQVKIVYSPLDAVKIAQQNPDKEVVFFAIGFETTAPANVMSVLQAKSLGLKNFSVLVSQVTVPPAMHAILSSPSNRVQGFLAAGHVCSVMGFHEYQPIALKYQIPITVTGFEPLDLLKGILMTVEHLEAGKHGVLNGYPRVVSEQGNLPAQALIKKVYQDCDRNWRGIGLIPMSGWCLRPEYAEFNAETRFSVENIKTRESEICIAGQILQGIKKPPQCPAFANECTPENPLGATMVSSEGACAAYYRYARFEKEII
ncbi:MAG: hydrogenase expression/formation protein HypD [Chloroflexi bacterium]|nr:MAG: hydrogenase expression/formation protein HypD [Chloroflexota bacterium]MBA4375004.1 hydrogenase formation protein HypD [Anaerolinea sp.]